MSTRPTPSDPAAALTSRGRVLVPLLGLAQLGVGSWALQAAMQHRAAYPESWQYALDLAWSGLLALSGLGLLRRRRWAGLMSTALLYLAFFVVLAGIALLYAPDRWWYWLLPPALPVLGWTIHTLRVARRRFVRGC